MELCEIQEMTISNSNFQSANFLTITSKGWEVDIQCFCGEVQIVCPPLKFSFSKCYKNQCNFFFIFGWNIKDFRHASKHT